MVQFFKTRTGIYRTTGVQCTLESPRRLDPSSSLALDITPTQRPRLQDEPQAANLNRAPGHYPFSLTLTCQYLLLRNDFVE